MTLKSVSAHAIVCIAGCFSHQAQSRRSPTKNVLALNVELEPSDLTGSFDTRAK